MQPNWVDDILTFWFSELTQDDWWSGGAAVDGRIRDRFLALHEQIAADIPEAAWREPRAALAAIIALDQFPRNMFRKTARAFATDRLALELSKNAVAKGLDEGLSKSERQFMYMPHVHSEQLADQDRCVELFRGLDDKASVDHAIEHRDIVAEYGRFPHRNRALGRDSTPEEIAFMSRHKGFGQ